MMLSLLLATLLTPWGENGSYKSGHAEYPRPQLVRTNWTNLNGEWDYVLETNTVAGLPVVRAQGKIRVPFCFESALSGVGIKVTPEDRMIYRRTVELHPKKGRRTLLNFEAVDYSTQVFVNGVEATDAPHEGGNLPFTVDITPFVREGANALEVKVWDPTEGQHGGRGKQALKPSGCYYTRVSGIWQTVWLEEVPERYIRGYKVITDIGKGTVKFDFDLAGFGDVTVKVDGVLQSGEPGESGEVVVRIPNAEPWSPENPKLYEFTAKYGEDEVRGYFAFRSVDKAADANGHMRFRLNGRPFYPLATLDQGWWPDGLLTPPCEEAMAFDLWTLKACGFNALRKHIKVEPRRYYYLCDKMGLAVIQDLPSGHEGMEQIDKSCARRRYGFSRAELKEMIDHLHNEPCIIMWMPYNEGWGQPVADLTRETLRWTRRYDPTRLVGGPSGWDDWEGGRHMKSCIEKWAGGFTTTPECLAADGVMSADTVDWHVYPGPALPVADRGRISFLGEFGGLGLRVPGHLWKEDGAWGYGDTSKATDPKEMQQRYLKLMDEVRGLVGKGLAGSVYTQTTDVEIEINGLMTYDRKVLKYDAAALKAAHQRILDEATDVSFSRTMTCLSGSGWTCDGEAVSVPHTWNAADACDGPGETVNTPAGRRGGDSVGGIGYLKKRAVYARQLPAKRVGRRYFLRFEGASVVADVKVNGRAVGSHVGAFTAFAFEVTDFLRSDGESELEVAVDNRWREDTQPLAADYSVYGGLYRNVWLIETDPVCIDPLTDGADGVKVTADPKTGDVTVEVAVLGGTNEVQRFHVEKPELWCPENPKLYTRRIEIAQKGSRDAVDVRFAFRTFEFRDGLFYLNGRQRKLRGVNRHQDRAGKGWAVSPEDEEEDIRLMKEMGADALRTAHYPQSRHIYDLCDELGLICWVEYPNVDRVTFSDVFERGLQRQVREMVEQLRNHPCIAMWSIFNELYMCAEWMRPHADELNAMMERTRDLVHRLDPSRPVVGVMAETGDPSLNRVPDELGLNVYPKWYSSRTMREMLDWLLDKSGRRTFAISEYGVGASVLQHGDPAVAVRSDGMWHPEEYQAYRMHDNLLALMREPRVWGTYVWSMFDFGADNRREGDRYGINDKGIVTHDRRTKKDVFYLYQANWTKTPVLHLVGQRMTSVTNGTMTVMGFSNMGDVTLKVNGKTVGTQKPDEACGVCWRNVRLEPGENRIELSSGMLLSSAVWNLRTAIVDGMDGWRTYWRTKRPALDAAIEQLRKRDYDFAVTNEQGHALTNVEVEVRQVSSDFVWGCAALSLGQLGPKNAAYEARLSEFFNTVTTTFCPGALTPKEGTWRFEESSEDIWRRPPPDRVLAFARKHGMRFKGQPLMCDRWHPDWAMGQTKTETEAFYVDFFRRVAARYGTSAWAFDVVNEAFCTRKRTPRFPLYGGDDGLPFVDWAFAEAAKVFPANCALNINMGIEATDWAWEGEKYYNLCKRILDAGIRLDGIGFQFHLFSKGQLRQMLELKKWHPDMLAEFYRKMGGLGRPVYINEITIPSTLLPWPAGEEIQAEVAADLYRFWFATPAIRGVTWWNLMDGAAWGNEDSTKGALLDDFAREKPVYRTLRSLIAKDWMTTFRAKTDATGHLRFRGFAGNYAVSFMNVTGNGMESRMYKGKGRKGE